MAESGSIQEGFLCPICHKDLRSPQKLISHFQDLHSEEQDILKSIREFYGKAKKKILKLDEQDLETFKNVLSLENLYIEFSEPQVPGCCTSHIELFKEIRRERLDHQTAETNKLIIRLDKLLRLDGTDRKQQEQILVAWLDGATVNRCPSCAASFNIARRQHHCRLCGSIMCNDCSTFLPFERAQSIVAPVQNLGGGNNEGIKVRDNEQFRICYHCSTMLERRRIVQAEQMMQPIISQLYAHLQKMKSQVQSMVDLYNKMYASLTSGEATFQLQDAQSLKASIGSKAEIIDTISKKIASLPVEELNPKVQALQNSIRRATSNYIKDYLLTLPPLPSVQEIAAIKENRSLKLSEDDIQDDAKMKIKKVTVTTGWSPSSFDSSAKSEEDPLIEQINIVRDYIAQARKAQRFEEVASLEENLKMLKEAYRKNQSPKQEPKKL
ncbi:rabenosyn-5 [Coccinella septempunctata]|uniref:rabenosyn-5 n=1 Tax=Coccinella septempunctata TaxID=41139 RepID=UPI001D061280|nr:rabenosyn-5 [Coccinella septempunctata]